MFTNLCNVNLQVFSILNHVFQKFNSDVDPPSQEKQKSTRRFPLSLASPLTIRKKPTTTETIQAKSKPVASVSGYVNTAAQSQGQASGNTTVQPNVRLSV